MKACLVQFELSSSASEPFWNRIEAHVADAARRGADLVMFPEYLGVEFGRDLIDPTDVTTTVRIAERADDYVSSARRLSQRYNIDVLAGTIPARIGDDTFNTAVYVTAGGDVHLQQKIVPIRWEQQAVGISRGNTLRVFRTAHAAIVIATCYDLEHPELLRAAAAHGAEVILSPSFCGYRTGVERVRVCARAAAVSCEAYVLSAHMVGGFESGDWSIVAGGSGAYTPIDADFPPNGILGESPLGTPTTLMVDLDLQRLRGFRAESSVYCV
ncbi:MAG: hypothetical protein KDD44_05825, partial [Bdellovibrionales bacterium]|nr:hypothetical protein [Bdellovibrionales bacterium]